jgi:hypothetical protein
MALARMSTYSSAIKAHRPTCKPNQRYGITFGAKLAGMMMDIDHLRRATVDKDNDLNKTIAFTMAQGPRQSAAQRAKGDQKSKCWPKASPPKRK